jgi:hypothetical protein
VLAVSGRTGFLWSEGSGCVLSSFSDRARREEYIRRQGWEGVSPAGSSQPVINIQLVCKPWGLLGMCN